MMRFKKKTTRDRTTFCRICEAACGLRVTVDAGRKPTHIAPNRDDPVSRGFACAKGTRFLEVANHPDRVLFPRYRQADGSYASTSWPEAMALITQRLRPLIERYGPHAIGIYMGNPLAFHTMGALSVLGLMHALGTQHVFTAGSQDCNNKFVGAQMVHGSALIHPLPDFEHADFALMLGTNPAVSQASFMHLEGGATVFDRMVRRGAQVIWVDPRRIESAQRWGEHQPIRPGTDIFLLLALLHELRGAYTSTPAVEGLDALLVLASQYPAERAAALTGIAAERLRDIAGHICHSRRATFHMSVGVNQGAFGTLCYMALQALAYLAGSFDQRGGVLFHPLAVWFSVIARRLGLSNVELYAPVGPFARIFKTLPGGIMADAILKSDPERLRALIVVGGDPLRSIPGESKLRRAFHHLDSLICVDLFQNTTGREADLILPTTSWLERWDMANTTVLFQHAPVIQCAGPVKAAPGSTRSEARILADLSLALGRPFGRQRWIAWLWGHTPWDRVLTILSTLCLFPLRLRDWKGIPVPKPKPGRYLGRGPRTPGHRVRFWHPALAGEANRLAAYSATCMPPEAGATKNFTMICRRRRLGQNSWLHGAVREGRAEAAAWLSPADLEAMGLPQGGDVRLQTDSATLCIPALPVPDVSEGLVVVPHGLPDMNVNALIPSGHARIEPLSGQHYMTGIPVRVMPLSAP